VQETVPKFGADGCGVSDHAPERRKIARWHVKKRHEHQPSENRKHDAGRWVLKEKTSPHENS
jgi:hypothetical protein